MGFGWGLGQIRLGELPFDSLECCILKSSDCFLADGFKVGLQKGSALFLVGHVEVVAVHVNRLTPVVHTKKIVHMSTSHCHWLCVFGY